MAFWHIQEVLSLKLTEIHQNKNIHLIRVVQVQLQTSLLVPMYNPCMSRKTVFMPPQRRQPETRDIMFSVGPVNVIFQECLEGFQMWHTCPFGHRIWW